MSSRLTFRARSPEETEALGRALGAALRGGETIALIGDLGAGKTLLARAMARGLGFDGPVPSPTFVLERRHKGRTLEMRHWDFYRLDENSDVEELGFFDRGVGQVVVVEWPERAPDAIDPDGALVLKIGFDVDSPDARLIELKAPALLSYLAVAARDLPFAASMAK
jgi:tRNA threonylcarbamoyladenosine biosynthesis protein TsaE